MDVVRFAETHGYEWNHEVRDAWRYRDYLIRAFNEDLPYDDFVREHIAGDLLATPRMNEQLQINESIIGTAFWRFGELGHDNCVDFPEIRFDALDNQIDTFAKAFQGLTISCARCHDHKLDAISSRDYYALVGVLESCSQVVHTIDSPARVREPLLEVQELKSDIRQRLSERWLAAIDASNSTLASVIAGESYDNASTLTKYIADEKLDYADPGYLLGRLSRRDAGTEGGSTADTADLRQAHWLWYPEGNAAANAPIATRYFRRSIIVPPDRRVTQAWCLFAGDDVVTVSLNGKHLGTGNGHPMLVGVDLSSMLRVGVNEVAVANTNGNPQIQPNPGGWIGVIRVEFDRGDPLLVYSDANWKSSRTVEEDWQTAPPAGSEWVSAMELGKAGISPWGFAWPPKSSIRREVSLAQLWGQLKREYSAEQERRVRFNSANFEPWSDFNTSFGPSWKSSGLGLLRGPSRAGEFTLPLEGEQIVSAVLPAGWYTNTISDRWNGSLRSPWLPSEKKYISVQLVGDGHSMVRTVVDSCALNEFAGGGLEYLDGGTPKWKRFPTSAGVSYRSFVELTTKSDNPRWPDRPGRAGTNDPQQLQSPSSSFGVRRAVLHDVPESPQPELTPVLELFRRSSSADAAVIASVVQAVARDAVQAWRDGCATDDDTLWIDWLLRVGLLPNAASDDPELNGLITRYRELASSLPEPRVVAGLADHGAGRSFPVLLGGELSRPGPVAPRRYLEVLSGPSPQFEPSGSGRRQLAEIIAGADNPLTARVMVNRVWYHLFGRGIVATPDDFGRMGEQPSHPELLDFLAADFVKNDWSVKRLIRLIVLSDAFQLSSVPNDTAAEVDPSNRLIHHYPARRLSAESVRDTMLAVSGRLDATLYGPSIHPHRKDEKDYRKLMRGPLDGAGRRSIYIKVTRMEGPQFLELFDFPTPMATRGRRDRTNVPAQALALLNDPFVMDQAKFWAKQLPGIEHNSVEQRVTFMFHKALGRTPSDSEREGLVQLVRSLAESSRALAESSRGEVARPDTNPLDDIELLDDVDLWQDVAHAIFNLKEFIYIR